MHALPPGEPIRRSKNASKETANPAISGMTCENGAFGEFNYSTVRAQKPCYLRR
jgi:hypothetical protein